MIFQPSHAAALSRSASQLSHCAHCDAPLPAGLRVSPALTPAAPAYCCYGCRLLGEAGRKPISSATGTITPWFKIVVVAVLAGQAMLLGLALNLTPPSGSARWLLHATLALSSLAALVILGPPLFRSAIEELRHRHISIELLFLAGIGGALGASLCSTVTGIGAVYYEVVAVLLAVYAIGKTLGSQSRARALAETRLLQRTFDTCHKMDPDGSIADVHVVEICPGDQVRVLPGEPIPIDGRILRGRAFVCETPLTGEPFPVVRRQGDEVFAGSYSEDGELLIAATRSGRERRLDGLLSRLESARERPCRIQAQADAMVRWFLPIVLSTSLLTFLFWTWRADASTGLFNALAVLLVACPCAMGLATPIALWSGLATLATRGLVTRGGDAIERLASVNRMVFDKTGTLSEEQFSLIDLATAGSMDERQLIATQLHAVQQASSHPVARAFDSTHRAVTPVVFKVRSLKAVPALGVEAWLESGHGQEHHLRVGQRGLMIDLTGEAQLLSSLRRTGLDHLVFVQVDDRLRAVAAVRERLRDSVEETMHALEQLGVECAVMTGDRSEQAAQLLGWDHVQGGLTPQEKADQIEDLIKAGGRIGFVGDGVNDALAMQTASVSIALAHGAGVTTAGADAVLYGGDLRVLPWAVALTRQVRDSIRANLGFALVYNAVGMALAAAGFLHPVAAALLMVISSFTVSWRALRGTEQADCCAVVTLGPGDRPLTSSIHAPSWLPHWLTRAEKPAPTGVQDKNQLSGRVRIGCGILVLTQAPFLIYLGHLRGAVAIGTLVGLLGLGVFIMRFRTRNTEWARLAHMTFTMLGLGNWGMILGWWMDAGFAPTEIGCPHCAMAGFGWGIFTNLPWMNLGMLLFGLPPMMFGPSDSVFKLGRFSLGLMSGLGMLWGMNFGNYVFIKWLGSIVSQPFLVSWLGMSIGMLLGMFLCCEFGRAMTLALARRGTPKGPLINAKTPRW